MGGVGYILLRFVLRSIFKIVYSPVQLESLTALDSVMCRTLRCNLSGGSLVDGSLP